MFSFLCPESSPSDSYFSLDVIFSRGLLVSSIHPTNVHFVLYHIILVYFHPSAGQFEMTFFVCLFFLLVDSGFVGFFFSLFPEMSVP